MNPRAANLIPAAGILALSLLLSAPVRAQTAGATLSGTVTSSAGKALPGAKISVKKVATGQTAEAQVNSAGIYRVPRLAPGDYEVSVSAQGFNAQTAKVTLAAGAVQTLNVALSPSLSLQSLGFSLNQVRGSAKEQALLNKRSHMLQVHQKLGLITTFPLAATVISGAFAGGKATSSTNRDLHAALGSATTGLYFATAYYAIFAPKVHGVKASGPIRLHKALAWIHGPGMILTPILGEMAFAQRSRGERVHGIARGHTIVGVVTLGAYVAALLSVTKPHLFSATGRDARALFGDHHSAAANALAGRHPRAGKEGTAKNRRGGENASEKTLRVAR